MLNSEVVLPLSATFVCYPLHFYYYYAFPILCLLLCVQCYCPLLEFGEPIHMAVSTPKYNRGGVEQGAEGAGFTTRSQGELGSCVHGGGA